MSSSFLRRTPSLQVLLPSSVAGTVRVICPSATRPQTPRKRKIGQISSTTAVERIAMTSAPSLSSSAPSRRPLPSLPELDIPQYRPQFASTPIEAGSPYNGPPSPTSTEIIDVEAEDFTRTAQQHGVQVRDFAFEPKLAAIEDSRIKEFWDPLNALLRHDLHIRKPMRPVDAYRVFGKDLYRLRDIGWVTEEEARKHWSPEDWKAMEAYRDRAVGPYPYTVGSGRRKPTRAFRIYLRKAMFPLTLLDISDRSIFMPEDEPGMWDGEDAKEKEEDEDASGRSEKKRKVLDEEATQLKPRSPKSTTDSFELPVSGSTSSAPTPSISRTASHAVSSPSKRRSMRRSQTLVRVQ